MKSAHDDVCTLQVEENLEGRMMRQMQKAIQACEERMIAKLEASIVNVRSDLQQVNTKVSSGLAPLVQCLALEQVELRNMCNSLTPMMQCVALEQIDARNKIDNLSDHKLESNAFDLTSAIKSLEDVEKELEKDCALQAASYIQESAEEDVKRLRQEVSSLDSVAKQAQVDSNVTSEQPSHNRCEQQSQTTKSTDGYAYYASDARHGWPQPPAFNFAYSSKILPPSSMPADGKWRPQEMWRGFQSDDLAAFPQFTAPTSHISSALRACRGTRSMPLLPPLQ